MCQTNSFIDLDNNYLEFKHYYENNLSLDTYSFNKEMNSNQKKSVFIFPVKDDINKKVANMKYKDNGRTFLEKLCTYKNRNSDNNPLFQLEAPKYEINIKENTKENIKEKKTITELGRKRDRSKITRKHDKYSVDLITRKCKYLVIKNLFDFINKRINFLYNGKLGNSIFKKELKLINQNQISNGKTQFNQKFLTKTIGDIYSDDLSRRHTIIPLNHNKNLIYKLMNDKDENKKNYFQKLFRLTFIQ